jgi:clan AA aspartic protease
MITGVVNADREATIRLPVQDVSGREHEIEAVLDTGFNGSLTLPPALIATLGLPWRTRGLVVLANGAEEQCDIYAATLIWDGIPRRILVEAADTTPLIGMALLHGHEVRIQVVEGGGVIVEALPGAASDFTP